MTKREGPADGGKPADGKESGGRPNPASREITYQVGWRTGTIRLKPQDANRASIRAKSGRGAANARVSGRSRRRPESSDRAPAGVAAPRKPAASASGGTGLRPQASGDAPAFTASGLRGSRAAGLFLHPAPQPTYTLWRAALPALTAGAFALLLWLASKLSP